MKEITKFAYKPAKITGPLELDSVGSSIDKVFADAVLLNEPATPLEEAGVIRVKKVDKVTDTISFPIHKNKQVTWSEIKRTGENVGSDLDPVAIDSITYKEITPTYKTASIFIPDIVSLVNGGDFKTYVEIVARDAKRKKEYDAIVELEAGSATLALTRNATAYSITGSAGTGSLLTPTDLLKARDDLKCGSYSAGVNVFKADFALMHDIQYQDLNLHSDFAVADTNNPNFRRAKFDTDGDLESFAGLKILVSPLMVQHIKDDHYWNGSGHLAIIGQSQLCLGRGEQEGLIINTQEDKRLHGVFKVIDMNYGVGRLVDDSCIFIRCSDA